MRQPPQGSWRRSANNCRPTTARSSRLAAPAAWCGRRRESEMDANATPHDRETLQRTAELRNALEHVVGLARSAGETEPDRQAAALFETTAEAVSGLMKAVEHF